MVAGTLPANCINDVIASQDDIAQRLDPQKGPLWLVRLYTTTSTDRFYVALTVCHVITDGRGSLKLFETLLSEKLDPTTAKVSSQTELSFPPSAKDGKKTLWSSSSLTKLSSRARDKVTTAMKSLGISSRVRDPLSMTLWPIPGRSPRLGKRTQHVLVDFADPHIVARLSRFGKYRDMGKIQSILHTAVIVALIASTNASATNDHNAIGTETTVSLRPNEHVSFFGGNYVGLIQRRAMTTTLLVKNGRREARGTLDHLEKVSDLMAFLPEAGHENKPYRNSVGISNLGVLKPIENLQELWFCHTCTPWGNALNIDVVSLDGMLRVIVSRLAIDHPPIGTFVKAFKFAVERFAEDMDDAGMQKLQDDLLRDVVDDVRYKLRFPWNFS
ncbi:hypothetical protein E4T39_08042 [Aureobasidium subglaciale]|nr:hypothetical protein E4T39_08042 [Aureobasidium subglaciale]